MVADSVKLMLEDGSCNAIYVALERRVESKLRLEIAQDWPLFISTWDNNYAWICRDQLLVDLRHESKMTCCPAAYVGSRVTNYTHSTAHSSVQCCIDNQLQLKIYNEIGDVNKDLVEFGVSEPVVQQLQGLCRDMLEVQTNE